MRLRVTKLHREKTPQVEGESLIIAGNDVIRMNGVHGGTRSRVITGNGEWPEVGKTLKLACKPLNQGYQVRLFETSKIVRIKDDICETESGSLYQVEEVKDGE